LAVKDNNEIIIETDDDNLPLDGFWDSRIKENKAYILEDKNWVNVYEYFTDSKIWPRGLPLEEIMNKVPSLDQVQNQLVNTPIQQGLADDNPDVDAIFRLTYPLPLKFNHAENVALGKKTWCPFNSQNTTWFKEAFPLLYLPSHCSFRMTDIWRSFVAQRIAWTNDWKLLFHKPTVYQERNEHNLMKDFADEIPGYLNNTKICKELEDLDLNNGVENIYDNLIKCYEMLTENGYVGKEEMKIVDAWVQDLNSIG